MKRPRLNSRGSCAFRKIIAVITIFLNIFGTFTAGTGYAQIVIDGRTDTNVTTTGNVTDITTTTIVGESGLNSFSEFSVDGGSVVNLYLPAGTSNLVNLVHGSTTRIDGILNSIKDDAIGGNVYFLNPSGIVVGQSGVVNVGSLTLLTPTSEFLNQIVASDRTVNNAALTELYQGQVPINPSGSITVQGTVNAITDITLRSGDITNEGQIASGAVFTHTQVDFSDVVNTNGLEVGNRISVENGKIVIAAEGDFTNKGVIATNGAAGLDAGSIDIDAGGTIKLEQGSMLSAHADAPGTQSGDITITAAQKEVGFLGPALASTGIIVDGATIRGRNVTLESLSVADYSWSFTDTWDLARTFIGELEGMALGIEVHAAQAHARSSVTLKGSAVIDASGTVSLKADSQASAGIMGASLTQDQIVNLGIALGETISHANVDIQNGTSITGSALNVAAQNSAAIDVSVYTVSRDQATDHAVALTRADVASSATIASGATINVTGNVSISAINRNSFSTSATAMSLGQGVAGIAATVAISNTKATATTDANLIGIGNLTIEAADLTEKHAAKASGTAGAGRVVRTLLKPADKAQDYLTSKLQNKTLDTRSGANQTPKIAGALTIADSNQEAVASIGSGVTVDASGAVAVVSQVEAARVQNHATSSINSTANDPNNPGASISLGAAVAYGDYTHRGIAFIGDNAHVRATNVGVRSDVAKPYEVTWHKWEGVSTITSKINGNLGLANGFLTGYASADGEAEVLGLNGSVHILGFDNTSHAYIGRGASIEIKNGGSENWQTELPSKSLFSEGRTIDWTSRVDVEARSEIAGVYGSGNLTMTFNGIGGTKPGSVALGGAYGQVGYTSDTRAFIADGASVTSVAGADSVDVSVTALSREQSFLIAPSAGRGASFGLSGNFSLVNINSNTEASIDRRATIEARDVSITANDDILSFSIAGAFNKSDTVSVGVGIAIQDVDANTRAFIGDNARNLPGDPTSTQGVVRARSLGIEARTDGIIETISIAGTLTSNSDPNDPPGFLDKTKAKLTEGVDWVKSGVSKGVNYLKNLVVPESGGKATPPADPSPDQGGDGGYEPKFGLGVSGSSSVNLADLTTEAYMDRAVVNLSGSSPNPSRLSVGAVNGTHIGAFSGSAALMRAKAPSSSFSAAIAGAVAVNDFDTHTRAVVINSDVTGANDVSVTALSGGQQLAIGLGAAVNASAKQDRAVSAAGSVSVNLARNNSTAGVEGSSLTGTGDGDVDVVAYNRTDLGTGGGALLYGGRGGFGAAVTYSEIRNAANAYLTKAEINDFKDVRLEALTGSLIGAGGAMAGFTTAQSSVTLGGAFVISDIANETRATVDQSEVNASGDIGIVAQDVRGVAGLDEVIDANECVGTCDDAHEQIFDFTGSEVRDPGSVLNGSAIISVAGVVQAGRSNVGLSFTWNRIANTFKTSVTDSSLHADGQVDAYADSRATILGFSIGAGFSDKFAGGGSVTLNVIDNETSVQIESSNGSHRITGSILNVNARDTSAIGSTSGQVNASIGKASVGLTVAHNQITNATVAHIGNMDVTTTGAMHVKARNASTLLTASISGAVSQGVAVGGSAASAHIMNTTRASVTSGGSKSLTVGSLAISADDASTIMSAAGQVSAAVGGNVAVGGAAVVNRIENTTKALLSGMNVSALQSVDVKSTNDALIGTAAASGGGSTSVAVNASAAFSQIWNTTTSEVLSANGNTLSARSLTVQATDDSEIDALAGQVSVSTGAAAVGGAGAYNEIGNTTRAVLKGMQTITTGATTVDAKNSSVIRTVSASGGVASQAAVTFSLSVSVIGNTTEAEIDSSTINSGDVKVEAADASEIDSWSGQLSGSGTAAVGGAVTHSQITNATRSKLTGADVTSSGVVRILGTNSSVIRSGSSAAGISGKASVEGSITSAVVANVTEALADASSLRRITGSGLTVRAEDASDIHSFGGQLAGSGVAAVGGAVVNNVITNETRARVRGYDLNISGVSTILGTNKSAIHTAAVSGGFSGKAAVEGSIASAHIQNTTEADLDHALSTNTSNEISVLASDEGSITTVSGAAAVAGVAGVGAAASVNRIANTTRARVHGVAAGESYSISNLLVKAQSATKIENLAVGVGGALKVGVAGSTAVNLINNTTDSSIDDGAKILALNNVGVLAESHDLITNAAGAAGIGIAAAGVSGSVTVNQIGGSTTASISGADTQVTALAQDANKQVRIVQGELQDIDLASLIDLESLDPTSDWRPKLQELQRRESVRGVAVNAASTHSIQYVTANVAGGLYAGVAGTVSTNVITGSTHAYIDQAKINTLGAGSAGQALTVKASDHAYSHGIVGSVGIGAGGVGATSNNTVFVRDTKAYLSNSDDIRATGATTVDAHSSQGVTTIGAGAGGGAVGVAGTGNVAVFANQTEAFVDSVKLSSKDVSVRSDQLSRMFVAAGSVTVGAVGFSGALSTAVNVGSTRAYIQGSTVAATGNVAVDAHSETEIDNWAVGAAVGGAMSVAGNTVVSVMNNTTEAYLAWSSVGTAGQRAASLSVTAKDLATVRHRGGAVGIDIASAGIGAGASVTVVKNIASAWLDHASVYTREDVSVNAVAERDLDTIAISAGVGLAGGIGGVAAVTVVGTGVSGDILSELDKDGDGTLSAVDKMASGNRLEASESEGQGNVELVGGLTQDDINTLNAAGSYSVKDKVTGSTATGTSAVIGANVSIDSERDVKVTADERTRTSLMAGAGSASIGTSVGGSVGVVDIAYNVQAVIQGNADVSAGRDITVRATTGRLRTDKPAVSAASYQGSAGVVSLGAAVATVNVKSNVISRVGAGAVLNLGSGALNVSAHDAIDVRSHAEGYTAGMATAGAVAAVARKSGTTLAVVGGTSDSADATSIQIGDGSVKIESLRSGAVNAFSRAGAGGVLSGAGSGASAKEDGTVAATVGHKVTVNAPDADVEVLATARPEVAATSEGYGGALGAHAGVSVAEAEASPSISATIGSQGSLRAKNLLVRAELGREDGQNTARSHAVAIGGALLGVNATVSTARSAATVKTSVDSNLTIGELAQILAKSNSAQRATVTGVVGGVFAAGANIANAVAQTNTQATTGDISVTGGALVIDATGTDTLSAGATSGSGGVVAGAAAVAKTKSNSTAVARFGSGTVGKAPTADVTGFLLRASHTNSFSAVSDSINAAVVGMSGTEASNDLNSRVEAHIVDGAVVESTGIDVSATNSAVQGDSEYNAKAGAGGVIDGSAATSKTDVNHTTTLRIGDGVKLSSFSSSESSWDPLRLSVKNHLRTDDKAMLTTGGAITGPHAESSLTARLDGDLIVGTGAQLYSDRHIEVGAYTDAWAKNTALVKTYGGVSVAGGRAVSTINASQDVSIGENAYLLARGNVVLAAGQSGDGWWLNHVRADALTEVYNYTAAPLDTDPYASATANSRSTLTLGANSLIESVHDVTLAAYDGEVRAKGKGTGHNPYLEAFGTTTSDGHTNTSVSSLLNLNGRVRAGILREQWVTIDASGNVTTSPGIGWTKLSFNPQAEIQAEINYLQSLLPGASEEEKQQIQTQIEMLELLKGSVSSGTVPAVVLSDIYAAGGNVVVHGRQVQGSGQLTALGAPSITIDNASNRYLSLNRLTIPDQDTGGQVRFTGVVGRADALSAGLTFYEDGAGRIPQIVINNTYNAGGGTGPAIFLNDAVSNLRGLVKIFNHSGSLAQFADVRAQQIQIDVPNGSFIVNNPHGYYFVGGDPMSAWARYEGLPTSAQQAAYLAYNAAWNSDGRYKNSTDFTNYLKDISGMMYPPKSGGTTYVVTNLPNCYGDFKDCYPGQNQNDYVKLFNGFWMRKVPVMSLSKTGSYEFGDHRQSTVLAGGQIGINAKYIDINGTIRSGQPSDWSVRLEEEAESFFEWARSLYLSSGGALKEFDIPIYWNGDWLWETMSYYDKAIALRYNAETDQIEIDGINASGGGFVSLNGHIMSTNRLGNIEVVSGFGDVRIENKTDRAVVLKDINTGVGAVGEIKIRDTALGRTTWYVYELGKGLSVYDSRNGATDYADAYLVRKTSGTTDTYQPLVGQRYQWVREATLQREWDIWSENDFYKIPSPSAWRFTSQDPSQPNNPWRLVSTGITYGNNPNDAFFKNSITGSVSGIGFWVNFVDGSKGLPTEADRDWRYWAPVSATLRSVSSVKADNPVRVAFTGNAEGNINVSSRGGIVIGGTLSNVHGTTTLQALNNTQGITAGRGSLIDTRSLNMLSVGNIGSAAQPIITNLNDGDLVAESLFGDVAIDVVSGSVQVRDILAGSAGLAGDVILNVERDIIASSNGKITGSNITLTSRNGAIGSLDKALTIAAVEYRLADGSLTGGEVSAEAAGDIYLTETYGDLRLVKAHSSQGDVGISVLNGRLLNAARQQSVDSDREQELAEVWDQLHLVDGAYADALESTVKPYEASVAHVYHEYWRLRQQGVEAEGAFTLNPDALAFYAERAAYALGVDNPTEAQVRSYVQGVYEELTGFLQDVFGSDWRAREQFAQYQTDFVYTATDDEVERLTRGAVWLPSQLMFQISQNALLPESDTQVIVQESNLRGRNITVYARDGVGSLADPMIINVPTDGSVVDLTDEEKAALASAALPGDVQIVTDPSTGRPSQVVVRRAHPVYVEGSGTHHVLSGGDAFLRSPGTINVLRLDALGDILLAANADILNSSPIGTPAITGTGNLALEAGKGSIGTTDRPVTYDIDGVLSTARASQDLNVERLGGNLSLGRIYAGGQARLIAKTGSILGTESGLSILAESLDLNVSGIVDGVGGGLEIELGSEGFLTGSVAGTVRLLSKERLRVGDLSGGSSISLMGAGISMYGRLSANTVWLDSTGAVTQSNLGRIVTGQLSVTSRGGQLLTGANEIAWYTASNTNAGLVQMSNRHAAFQVGNVTSDADVVIDNDGSVELVGSLSTPGELRLLSTGAVVQRPADSSLTVGRLVIEAAGDITLGATVTGTGVYANRIGELRVTNAADGSIAVGNGVDLKVLGIEHAAAGDIAIDTAGSMLIAGDIKASDSVTLVAGGTITQQEEHGIRARLLTTHSEGGLRLLGANTVARLAAENANGGAIQFANAYDGLEIAGVIQTDGGDIVVTNIGALTLTGEVVTVGRVTLSAEGTITQAGAGRVTGASLLTTHSEGGQTLLGTNTVASFAANNVNGGTIEFANTYDGLEVAGIVQADGGDIEVTNVGSLVMMGEVRTTDHVTFDAKGAITQQGAGRVTGASLLTTRSQGGQTLLGANTVASLVAENAHGGAIEFANAFDGLEIAGIVQSDGGDVEVTNIGSLVMTGEVRTGDRVTLNAEGIITQQGAGRITGASLLTTRSQGGQTLLGANTVASLVAENAQGGAIEFANAFDGLEVAGIAQSDGGDVEVTNIGSLVMTGEVLTSARVTLDAEGTITQQGAGRITGASHLTTRSQGGQTLLGANTVASLVAENAHGGAIEFANGYDGLEIAGIVQSHGGDIEVTNVGSLVMTGEVRTGDRVTLNAEGTITQAGAGRVTGTSLLTTHSEGGQTLLGANTVVSFAANNANGGAIEFANTYDGLEIAEIVQSDGGDIEITNVGNLVITGDVRTSDRVTLRASEAITQQGAGRITGASLLTARSRGGQTLLGANTVARFESDNADGGAIRLVNTYDGFEIVRIEQTDGDDIEVTSVGSLVMTGVVHTADRVILDVKGTITQTASGRVTGASHLTTRSVGGQHLALDNEVANLTARNLGGGAITFNNRHASLTIHEVWQEDGGDIELVNAGALQLIDQIRTRDDVRLVAAGTIIQTGQGRVRDAASLTAVSVGGQTLEGDNTVARFNASNDGGEIRFANTHHALTLGEVRQLSDGDITVTNTGDILVQSVAATAGTVDLYATGSILNGNTGAESDRSSIDAVSVILTAQTGSIGSPDAYLYIDSSNAVDGLVTATAQQGIYLWETDGALRIAQMQTPGDIDLVADGSILNRGTLDAILNGNNVNLRSIYGQIGESDARLTLAPAGVVNAWALGSIYLSVPNGDLISDELESREGWIDLYVPRGAAKLNRVMADKGLALQSPIIHLNELIHTGDEPMRVILVGIDGLAEEVFVNGYSEVGMIFERLEADVARIDVKTDRLAFFNTLIGTRAEFRNNYYLTVAENVVMRLFPSHLQIYPRDIPFYLIFDADREILTDALAVNYDDDFIINRFHTENSVVRIASKLPDIVGNTEEPTYAPGVRIPNSWWLLPDQDEDEEDAQRPEDVLKLVDTGGESDEGSVA